MFEITPEMQSTYKHTRWAVKNYPAAAAGSDAEVLADALRDAVAAWLQAKNDLDSAGATWPQWQAEAHKRLMGE